MHPFAKPHEVLGCYREYTSEAPDEQTAAAGVVTRAGFLRQATEDVRATVIAHSATKISPMAAMA
jgi:hypothetical protein